MRDHTIEDYQQFRTLSGVKVSPDRKYVAFVASSMVKDFKGIIESSVILHKLSTGEEQILSENGTSNSSIEFSPDSSRVAFISSEKERNYTVIVEISTGNRESSSVRGKISSLKWLNRETLVLLAEDYHREEAEKKKTGNDGYFFEEDPKFNSLWSYTPGRGMRRITSGLQVWDFSLTGKMAAAVVSDEPFNWSWYESSIAVIDTETGESKVAYTPEKRQLSSPVISLDGSSVYFIESLMSDNGVESGDILKCDLKTGNVVNLTEGQEKTYTCFHESADGKLYTLANSMGTFCIGILGEDNPVWSSFGSVMPAFSPKFSLSGDIAAFAFTSSTQPQEVFTVDLKGETTKITKVNERLKGLKTYESRLIKWKSTDGLEIYGLFKKAADNAPLVVIVHGGPTSSSTEQFIDQSTLLLSAGFSVFLPNYRGSTGKGRKYAELNRGDMGGMDFTDVMAGLDHVLASESVDANRVYITGGSYGGFLSAWAVTQTDRFAASVSLFGIVDWISFHGVSSLASWDGIHYDQDPYEFDRFIKFSAIRYINNVRTPILLMHGIEDPYVPVGQYLQFYRALKEKKKEAKLLLFPREGHGFREKKHLEMYINEMIGWFNSHSKK